MKKISILLVGLFLSINAFASVKCGSELIKGVQIKKGGEVVYTSKDGVRRLVASPDAPAASQYMLMTLLNAVDNKYYVQAAFPDGYSCKSSNTEIPAEWIYVQNPK